MALYPFDVIAHKGDETLPVACVDTHAVKAMAQRLLEDGYEVVTVRQRIGETNQFRVIHHVDTRWMKDL